MYGAKRGSIARQAALYRFSLRQNEMRRSSQQTGGIFICRKLIVKLFAYRNPKAKPVSSKTTAKKQKEQEAREGEYMAGEADNVFALTTIYATKAQAMRAAQAKWDKLQRGVAEFSITLATGREDIYPEMPVRVSGFKSVIDDQSWIISKVTHNLGGNGFTTTVELEVMLSGIEYESEENDS